MSLRFYLKITIVTAGAIILAPNTWSGETRYILMDGGSSPSSNYLRFYKAILEGYDALQSIGKSAKVIAKDGTWKIHPFNLTEGDELHEISGTQGLPTYPRIDSAAQTGDDLKKIIKDTTKPGDQVLLYITPHGGPPYQAARPQTASVSLWDNDLPYYELTEILEGFPDRRFKIVTSACYGGGLHSVSRSLHNVCTASVTNYFTPASSGQPQRHQFDTAFWETIQKSQGKTTFANAAYAGFLVQNISNPFQASMSSLDYVDYVLGKGPYANDSLVKYGVDGNFALDTGFLQFLAPTEYQSTFQENLTQRLLSPVPTSLFSTDPVSTCSASVKQDVDSVLQVSRIIYQITRGTVEFEYASRIGKQPRDIQTIFNFALTDLLVHSAEYKALVQKYEQKFRNLKESWAEFLASIPAGQPEPPGVRAEFQKQVDELRQNSLIDLKQYSFDHVMLDRLKRLEEFSIKASPEEKSKFIELLRCEWEGLS